jgi:hypothetical protein
VTRFLALLWDDRDAGSLEFAARTRERVMEDRGWATVTDHTGLAVYIDQAHGCTQEAIELQRGAGVILGTLFKRSTGSADNVERTLCIGDQTSADILRTQGRSLIDANWGSYLLFLRHPEVR